jgi:ergothioneine biosynthesis protein EgtB
MGALAAAARIRHDILTRILDARSRTDELFSLIKEEAFYDRPIPERHRIIFYLGHVEAFDWNLLANRAFGLKSFHPEFDRLFAFGIDPVDGGLPTDQPSDWPKREVVCRYNHSIRRALDKAIEDALDHSEEGHPQLMPMLETAIEHRLMHAETLTYMLHRLPTNKKVPGQVRMHWATAHAKHRLIEIPAGQATLGVGADENEFGWDNESSRHEVDVPGFYVESHNVTNAEFLLFLQAGGYQERSLWTNEDWAWKEQNGIQHPPFWKGDGNLWMYRAMFGDVRLPHDWPAYVSHAEASAYAKWLGRALPTEAQFHRAAYGSPKDGRERQYPWGDNPPAAHRGNFDFEHWDPAPVGAHPSGASAFGVHDLVGNGWEWTRTVFEPFPGFAPMPFYPGYSANFFDGKHYVAKGGSPRTAACLLRRSFRNWFQPRYPYVYATFRCVEE